MTAKGSLISNILTLFILAYSSLYAQEKLYSPKYKQLQEFKNQAPDYLLRTLDSIFTSKEQIIINPLTLDADLFEKRVLELKKDSSSIYFNQSPFPNSFYNFSEDYSFLFTYDTNKIFDFFGFSSSKRLFEAYVKQLGSNISYYNVRNAIVRDETPFFWEVKFYNSIINSKIISAEYSSCILKTKRIRQFLHLPLKRKDTTRTKGNKVQFYNSYIDGYVDNNLERFSTFNTQIESLKIFSDSINEVNLDKQIFFDHFFQNDFDNNDLQSGALEIINTHSNTITIKTKFDKVSIEKVKSSNIIDIGEMMDTLIIRGGHHSKVRIHQELKAKKCKIYLEGFDLSTLETRWLGYELFKPDSSISDEKFNSIYVDLLANFKSKGYDDSYARLDKQHKSWNNLRNGRIISDWLQRNWSDYGYDKRKIIFNTFYIFLFFSFLNSFFLPILASKLYKDKNINKIAKRNKIKSKHFWWLYNLPASIFYTSKIFFSVGFKYDNLVYKDKLTNWKLVYLLYFFLIFVFGLICLAYIINFAISL